ncbi:MAG: Crp/Fnr family transcriptional regulator [Bacteroidota bacterium]
MESVFTYFDQFLVLSPEAKKLVLKCVDLVKIEANTEILVSGSTNNFMYIIKKGVVRGYYTYSDHEETISLWMEYDTFGDVSTYIANRPAIKSYQSIEGIEVYRVNIVQFRRLFATNHEICNLGRIIAEQFIVKTEFFKDNIMRCAAEEKYRFFIQNKPGLIDRVKLKHIASFLKITPETLSRIRKTANYEQRVDGCI